MSDPVDQNKRRTMKGVAAVAGAASLGTVPAAVAATFKTHSTLQVKIRQVWPPTPIKSPLKVEVKKSVFGREVDVCITNVSDATITLDQITPDVCTTSTGCFNLSSAVQGGAKRLAAGESVSIPREKMSQAGAESRMVKGVERIGISVVTGGDSFVTASYSIAT